MAQEDQQSVVESADKAPVVADGDDTPYELDPELRATILDAFVQLRMEFDRTLLTIDTALISGVTAWILQLKEGDVWPFVGLLAVDGALIASVACVLRGWELSSALVQAQLSGEKTSRVNDLDRKARKYDTPAIIALAIGGAIAIAIAVLQAAFKIWR